MTPLFFSAACDYCDGKVALEYHTGFVVYRGTNGEVHEEFVFRSPMDAERWRVLRGLQAFEVRAVHSEAPFRWRASTSRVRGLEHADHLYAIYPNRLYEPAPFRAHVAD